MFKMFFSVVSFQKRYVTASLLYVGLSLIILALHQGTSIMANSGENCNTFENPCPAGYTCCGDGTCRGPQ